MTEKEVLSTKVGDGDG